MSRQHLKNFMGLIALSFAFWYTAGPYSILRCYLGNPSDFDVVLGDFLWMIVLGTLLLTIATAGALLLIPSLRRKGTKSIWYAALLGITAATWIQITVLNTRTDTPMMQITGLLAIDTDSDGDLNITIEKAPGEYVLNYAHLSQDTTYIVEQIETKEVSKYQYEIKFYPSNLISGWYDIKLTDD